MAPHLIYCRLPEDDDTVEKNLVKAALDGNLRQLKGCFEVTEIILSKGVTVDIDCCLGTPFFLAATNEQEKYSKNLLDPHAKAGIMGGGKRKDMRVEDSAEILPKAPRLELPVANLEGSNDAALLKLSSNSKGQRCKHVVIGIDDLNYIHDEILSTKDPPICEECCVAGGIMVCTECNRHFCTGMLAKTDPQGHARWHANREQHWVGLVYNDPFDGYCFSCKHTLAFRESDVEEKGKGGVSDDAGGHVSELAIGNGYAIKGMPNLGLTCYMNALVQCLLALGKLRIKMLQHAPSGSLGVCLKDLFVETSIPTNGKQMMKLKTQNLLNSVRNMDAQFTGVQDSHDLFISMCDYFDKVDLKKPACMEGGVHSAMIPTNTTSIFSIELCVTICCKVCLHKSASTEMFYNLSASMSSKDPPDTSGMSPPKTRGCRSPKKIQAIAEGGESQSPDSEFGQVVVENPAKTLQVDCAEVKISRCKEVLHGPLQTLKKAAQNDFLPSIEHCLISNHFNVEELDRKCGNCGSTKGVQTTVISKLPPVLIIHLKRYEKGSKLSGHVTFEETLDVGPFMDPRSEDKEKARYRLVGVIEHSGPKSSDGHYIAYVRAGQKQHSGYSSWFCADDSVIEEVSPEKVFSCQAYLLFYERMED